MLSYVNCDVRTCMAFLKRSPRRWLNILWGILFFLYIGFMIFFLRADWFPAVYLDDYRAFYASAQIALTKGFSQVYDLQLQGEVQTVLQRQSPFGQTQADVVTVPMPYLPVFILFFLPLPLLGYISGYVVWLLFNVILLLAYLYRFTRALGKDNGRDLLLQLVVSLIVISNFLVGQVNVFLLICVGEFLLAIMKKEERLSGLWLGGLLLKPQTLILILPALLFRKRYQVLIGFFISAAVLFGVSLLFVGPSGLGNLAALIMKYVHGIPSNAPEAMMNWRSLATNLSALLPGPVAWVIAAAGILVTLYLTFSLWALPIPSATPEYALLLLATFAGTISVTWHAHNHMEMVLIPLILYLYARKMLPWKILYLWLLGPPVFLGVMVLAASGYAYNYFGLFTLALNLTLLVWSGRSLRSWSTVQPSD